MGKKPMVSVTYEDERISIKNSLPYLKCVLRLSCVVHGPIYGRFKGFYVNSFLYIKVYLYIQRKPFTKIAIEIFTNSRRQLAENRMHAFNTGLSKISPEIQNKSTSKLRSHLVYVASRNKAQIRTNYAIWLTFSHELFHQSDQCIAYYL